MAKDYTDAIRRRADQILDSALDGIGYPERERSFSMCLTHCRHRALTDHEVERLPESWRHGMPSSIAGGPLVVHWTRGIDPTLTLSADPCDHVRLEPHPDPRFGGVPVPVD